MTLFRLASYLVVVPAVAMLAACEAGTSGSTLPKDIAERRNESSIFGESITLLGGKVQRDETRGEYGVGVNAYLWRAALDTVSFMPIAAADPFGGTILTDWYVPPQTPSERVKVNIAVLTNELRADGIRVSLFRQVQGRGGEWADAEASEAARIALEDTILQRARDMRVAFLNETR